MLYGHVFHDCCIRLFYCIGPCINWQSNSIFITNYFHIIFQTCRSIIERCKSVGGQGPAHGLFSQYYKLFSIPMYFKYINYDAFQTCFMQILLKLFHYTIVRQFITYINNTLLQQSLLIKLFFPPRVKQYTHYTT